ncbi:hypothetical protein BV25DRAFT_1800963 [Artomyces pyxidatus]|uniref:Uncharacterized protein n=1 Tax=Artomyces pyxidatus TaxID=48021 RepID=A0ACB8T6V2_9AGAM|nr:hypothetical protein BV25DRAFT_1800963 [Artomyces pyxidatus]
MDSPSSLHSSFAPPFAMAQKPRTLVLCFDGTTNEFDKKNTNVVKFFSLLKKDRIKDQMCYYQAGIGTYFEPGIVQPLFRWGAKILDEAFAWYLPAHVMEGYKFLMQNYDVGDKVCIFGFSRGAYTARAIAGMLHKVGLLLQDNAEQVGFAYKLYASSSKSDIPLAAGFKATFSREVPIEFLGVWDTVASVGVIMTRTLPFVGTNTTVKTFRQALALDEHRALFRPNVYHRPSDVDQPLSLRVVNAIATAQSDTTTQTTHTGNDMEMDNVSTDSERFVTDVEEVWFSGCHSDIGGGAALDTAEYALANIPLRWMVCEVVKAQCGIIFNEAAAARWKIPITLDDLANGNGQPNGSGATTSEDPRDAMDVAQPLNDQLKKNPLWWILEIFPTEWYWQNAQNKWVSRWSIHLGRGRVLPENPKFHQSVKIRMDDQALQYTPRARFTKGTETFVL